MINRNTIFPIGILFLSFISLYFVSNFDEPMFQDSSTGAKFFPTIILVIQMIICLALIVQDKITKDKEPRSSHSLFTVMSLYGVLFVLGYVSLISVLGYLISSLVAFTVYLLFLKVKKVSYYFIAWVFVGAVYYVFGEVFVIALPEGILF